MNIATLKKEKARLNPWLWAVQCMAKQFRHQAIEPLKVDSELRPLFAVLEAQYPEWRELQGMQTVRLEIPVTIQVNEQELRVQSVRWFRFEDRVEIRQLGLDVLQCLKKDLPTHYFFDANGRLKECVWGYVIEGESIKREASWIKEKRITSVAQWDPLPALWQVQGLTEKTVEVRGYAYQNEQGKQCNRFGPAFVGFPERPQERQELWHINNSSTEGDRWRREMGPTILEQKKLLKAMHKKGIDQVGAEVKNAIVAPIRKRL